MYPIPNGFRSRVIPLYSSKIVDKKEILRAVSNTGIYCSSDKVGTVIALPYLTDLKILLYDSHR
jgi:predicted transport protein